MIKTTTVLTAGALACAFSLAAFAAGGDYKAEKKQINADYKAAMAQCKTMKGDEKKSCEKDAKAKRKEAMANEKAEHKGKASTGASTPAAAGTNTPPASGPAAPTTAPKETPPSTSGGMGSSPGSTTK